MDNSFVQDLLQDTMTAQMGNLSIMKTVSTLICGSWISTFSTPQPKIKSFMLWTRNARLNSLIFFSIFLQESYVRVNHPLCICTFRNLRNLDLTENINTWIKILSHGSQNGFISNIKKLTIRLTSPSHLTTSVSTMEQWQESKF